MVYIQHPKVSDDVLKISADIPFNVSSLSSIRMCFANKNLCQIFGSFKVCLIQTVEGLTFN